MRALENLICIASIIFVVTLTFSVAVDPAATAILLNLETLQQKPF